VTRRLGFLVLVLLLALAAPAGAADWSAWQRYMEAAERAWEQGRLSGAEQRLEDAVREAELQDPRSPQLVRSLTVLAEVYRKQGRERDAQAVAARASAISRATASSGADVTEHLQAYATLLRELDRDVDARAVEARVQRLREVGAGDGRGNLLYFNPVAELREYAALLRRRNRDADARLVDARANAEATRLVGRYEALRKEYSREPAALPSVTWVQQIDAGSEARLGRLYPEAEGLYRDAAKTAESFEPQDARRAYSLSLLAYTLRAQGKRDEFERTVERVLPMLEPIAGSGHAFLARSFALLAQAYLRFNFDGAEALTYFQRSLPLLEKDLRGDHPAVGLHVAGVAAARLALDQPEAAEPALQRALAIAGAQTGPDDAMVARGLVTVVLVYMRRGDYARADAVADRVVNVYRRTLHPDHPEVLFALALQREVQAKATR